ncbi:MAG: type II toxin-antitoxin system HicA family toxin [Nitrospiria bacterium]
MKAISGKDFVKLFEKNGWELRRTKGSHHIYVKGGNPERISVPIHGNKPLKLGLLKYLLKVSEIIESEL